MSEGQKEVDSRWKPEYRKDVVYLHVLSRSLAGSIVNLSPFALKLETWLRINKIPFQVSSAAVAKQLIGAAVIWRISFPFGWPGNHVHPFLFLLWLCVNFNLSVIAICINENLSAHPFYRPPVSTDYQGFLFVVVFFTERFYKVRDQCRFRWLA